MWKCWMRILFLFYFAQLVHVFHGEPAYLLIAVQGVE